MKKISIILLFVVSAFSLRAQVLPSDSLALVSLYNATGGQSWTNHSNWLTGPVPTWFGVTVDNKRVVKLELCTDCYLVSTGNNLNGILPASIGDLTALTSLALPHGSLPGEIPAEIGNLVNLRHLDLSVNGLIGEIPTSIGNLVLLQALYIAANKLEGTLPKEIGNLTALTNLSMNYNKVTGKIPDEIGNLTQLVYLQASDNMFTDTIPETIGNLTNLLMISLEKNQLTGPIPPEIGNLSHLYALYLQDNDLTGSLPAEIGGLTSLSTLYLNGNQLKGSIPKEIGQLTSLYTFIAYDNQFSGEIPVEMGNLTSLRYLSLNSNSLSGEIPSSIGNLVNLYNFSLSNNELTGNIPASLGALASVDAFDLSDNKLDGPIPASLGNLKSARYIFLDRNDLTGALPVGFSSMPALQYLHLYNNELTDVVDLSANTQFVSLDMRNNKLTFEDIEPNYGISGLKYLPQQPVSLAGGNQALVEGDPFTASFAMGGSFNEYRWEKNGMFVPGAISSTLHIPAVSVTDAGSYRLVITNTKVSGLFFTSDPIVLTVAAPEIHVYQESIEVLNAGLLSFPKIVKGKSTDVSIRITNTGDADLVISNIASTGDFSVAFAGATIAPGADLIVTCRFTPSVEGVINGSLTISGSKTISFNITGIGYVPAPVIELEENKIVFGRVLVGNTLEKEVRIVNRGDADLVVSAVETVEGFVVKAAGMTISAGTSRAFNLEFIPTEEKEYAGRMIIKSNDGQIFFDVVGTGYNEKPVEPIIPIEPVKAPKMVINENTISFALTETGGIKAKQISIANTGTATLQITSFEITDDFKINITSLSILPSDSKNLEIIFMPSLDGDHRGMLTLLTNADSSPFSINLEGTSFTEQLPIEEEPEVEVYNVVTTRQNGKNDFFKIKNISLFPGNEVQVFDRWGNRVYSKTNYDNENGVFRGVSERGNVLPEGTYFYMINKNNGSEPLTGFLLVRN